MLSRRTRYAAPVVVVGLIAAGAWVPTLRAAASPDLPAISAPHLVERVLGEKVHHLSGSFAWTADLGLPAFTDVSGGSGQDPSSASGFDPTSLLSGRHAFEVWIDGGGEQRVAAPGTLQETDAVHRGNQAWVYDSATNHVTHYILRRPARPVAPTSFSIGPSSNPVSWSAASSSAASSRADWSSAAASKSSAYSSNLSVTLSPEAVADQLLATARSDGTRISVSRPVDVAGRAAYVLRLAPDRAIAANRASTVSYATIAVDAGTGLPLRASVYAVGQSSPALEVGFTSISFATPSASEFAALEGQSTTTKVVSPPADGIFPGSAGASALGVSRAQSQAAIARAEAGPSTVGGSSHVNVRWAEGPVALPETPALETPASETPASETPASEIPASISIDSGTTGSGQARIIQTDPDSVERAHTWGAIADIEVSSLASRSVQGELDSLTTVVSGRWGSGRLLSSTLLNALLLPDGRVLVGAVTPAALEAAAAHLSH